MKMILRVLESEHSSCWSLGTLEIGYPICNAFSSHILSSRVYLSPDEMRAKVFGSEYIFGRCWTSTFLGSFL